MEARASESASASKQRKCRSHVLTSPSHFFSGKLGEQGTLVGEGSCVPEAR